MKKLIVSLILSVAVVPFSFAAGDAAAGKAKTAVCAACHGEDTLIDLSDQLCACLQVGEGYRSGVRVGSWRGQAH